MVPWWLALPFPLGQTQAFRWTKAGMVGLGVLPGHSDQPCDGRERRWFRGGRSSPTSQAFRWTKAGGMVDLGILPGHVISAAKGVSADGSVVVGNSNPSSGPTQAFRWTAATGMKSINAQLAARGHRFHCE